MVGFYWTSDDQNGVTGGCRSMLMYFTRGVRLNLYLEDGSTYSDDDYQLTSLAVFRLHGSLTSHTHTHPFNGPFPELPR